MTEREKEREAELESAMYTNCLLIGLDPAVIGMDSGGGGSSPRVGHFRHSNPKLGEQLLYFLLSGIRGPYQSAKDFDKVWPIFDAAQSRDFRKIVQGIISELESQGALPRNNARVSSLATCCGPRFVELCWQLSVHALREVHLRAYPADVSSNPLPAILTDRSYQHAAALLPITKARIALERKRFLENASIAVQRKNTWSNLAHEMTAEFRGLCAEEAYLQQELEKLQDVKNKAKLEGELWDDCPSSSGQNSHLVSKATRIWESLLSKKGQHEVLASGPIEDLIAHREHRYRISGSSLLAEMDLSSHVPGADALSVRIGDASAPIDSKEQMDTSQFLGKKSGMDDRGRVHPPVDVAEILRRWTHALQRIHKQSLHLAKANDGEGPSLFCSSSEGGTSGHAESLSATLVEHRQHLVSMQGLINQLKEAIPEMQKSISDLTHEVGSITSTATEGYDLRTSQESTSDEVNDMTSRLSSVQLEKVSTTSTTLKLPQLFNLTPGSSGKTKTVHEIPSMSKSFGTQIPNGHFFGTTDEFDSYSAEDIKCSVRAAALLKPSSKSNPLPEMGSDEGTEHFFLSLSEANQTRMLPSDNAGRTYTQDYQVFSPPLLMDTYTYEDEDLLAPLSETDTALMNNIFQHE